ncbi:hypothetical protein EHF44_15290 [Cupriavidus pauculus]|uniref:Bacterial sugar transferase domain-containing protein n=1 Tax=Cupriavidus pauculus TaxID=82633 RepID=A0A3G8H2I1_9BURK|nr:hypothetical protein EHF44_15290 [Cupriavidus pauculus]
MPGQAFEPQAAPPPSAPSSPLFLHRQQPPSRPATAARLAKRQLTKSRINTRVSINDTDYDSCQLTERSRQATRAPRATHGPADHSARPHTTAGGHGARLPARHPTVWSFAMPARKCRVQWRVKRTLDIVIATTLLLALSPLLALLALLIKRDGGPCFFSHPRVGMHGRTFRCLKFRSMVRDADKVLNDLLASDPKARAEWEQDFKLRNDVRVTRLGRFLRRTSLDELPQLWNVLLGDMSLVGPRPVVEKELGQYGEAAGYYLRVLPGITGLWQVSGRSETSYERRVLLDVSYVKNWSLAGDLRILFRTVGVVLGGRGAY